MRLIKMTDFVLEQTNKITNEWSEDDQIRLLDKISNYANFLKQPLKLEMFVPFDDEGNVLIKPICNKDCNNCECMYEFDLFEEAKEKVLFEGFQYHKEGYVTNGIFKFDEEYLENKTIEDLVEFDLTLTESAIKKLGL